MLLTLNSRFMAKTSFGNSALMSFLFMPPLRGRERGAYGLGNFCNSPNNELRCCVFTHMTRTKNKLILRTRISLGYRFSGTSFPVTSFETINNVTGCIMIKSSRSNCFTLLEVSAAMLSFLGNTPITKLIITDKYRRFVPAFPALESLLYRLKNNLSPLKPVKNNGTIGMLHLMWSLSSKMTLTLQRGGKDNFDPV
nr:ORF53 [Bracoviriform inaniti]